MAFMWLDGTAACLDLPYLALWGFWVGEQSPEIGRRPKGVV